MSIQVRQGRTQYDVELVEGNEVLRVLTWPEANKLQHDLFQACVKAGITIMGGIQP